MLYRLSLAALAAGSLMATAALAQTGWVEIRDAVQVEAFAAPADQVDDWDVYDALGTRIGEVEEVIGPDADTPVALVVDFEGVAGYADRDVIIPLDQFTRQDDRLTLGASPDAVGAMEIWND